MQGLVATVRGGFNDLAWQPPEFIRAARQLVGFELFRDDTSTQPPSRLTWRTMPPYVLDARGLEIVPHSQYGVLAIWRRTTEAEPIAAIEYGPARLIKDLAGPAIVIPAEQRIQSLSSLQRQGLITSEEMELAIDRLLGRSQPPIEDAPKPKVAISEGAATGAAPAKTRRLVFAYVASAVVLVLVLVVAGQYVGRLLLSKPSAANIAASPTPAQPSPSGQPSPAPGAGLVNLRAVLIKPADLRPGYVGGAYGSTPLCPACVPQSASLAVQIQNKKLKRTIFSGASMAPSPNDAKSVAAALMAYRVGTGAWRAVTGLGDGGFASTVVQSNLAYYFVVWRTGPMTNEIILIVPSGTLNVQSAIDLAKIQQARVAKALR